MESIDAPCDGEVLPAIPPINMTETYGKIICGKRGGPTFLETVRVEKKTRKCPENYVACSRFTGLTETVCIEPDKIDDCPIIDLLAINNYSERAWKELDY